MQQCPDLCVFFFVSLYAQAALDGKGKKGESVVLYVTVDGKKFAIGTLSQENIPQLSFDLVFEKQFVLSTSSEKASVHFVGYKSPDIDIYPFICVFVLYYLEDAEVRTCVTKLYFP